jgi:hypothetical protein
VWSKSTTSTDERRRNWRKKIEEFQSIKGISNVGADASKNRKELRKMIDWFGAWLSDSTIADDVKIVVKIAARKRVDVRG